MGYTKVQVLAGRSDVFISDEVAITPASISYRPDTVYMIGTGTTGTVNTPIDIADVTDFTTKIGTSPSLSAVQNYFANAPTNGLYLKFIRFTPSTPIIAGDLTAALAAVETGDAGLIIAPEIFDSTSLGISTQTAIALAMGNSAEVIGGLAIIDTPYSVRVIVGSNSTGIRGFTASLSANSFIAVYFPRVKYVGKSTFEAASPALISAFSKRWADGIQNPPAGVTCPIVVSELEYTLTNLERDTLGSTNPIRKLKVGQSYKFVVWGAETASGMAINTRLILSSIVKSLDQSMTGFLFSSVDNRGSLLSSIGEAARSVMFDAWTNGYLQGLSPAEAFTVKCDRENNLPVDLDQGLVVVEVKALLAGTVQFILVSITKQLASETEGDI